jgi:hypothetical protein
MTALRGLGTGSKQNEAVMMDHHRFDYFPIIKRKLLSWPNGAKVAVWIIHNTKHFEFDLPGTCFILNIS